MKKLFHLENADCPMLQELVEGDVSYTVLYKILEYECDHIFSDGESFIICHSNPPYPVWVWCKSNANKECIKNIAKCIKENFPLDKFEVTISKDTLNELAKVHEYFKDIDIKVELLSYKLTKIESMNYPCDGRMELADIKNLEALAKIWQDMAFEMEGFEFDLEHCTNSVRDQIEDGRLFVWKNANGEIVATANYGILGSFGKVAGVYTLPNHRRKGYAINLVSNVTKIIIENGVSSTLYTDGNYRASNECYKKIGYKQVGQLLTIYKI